MGAYSVISPQAMVNGQPEDVSVIRANFEAIAAIINALDDSNIAPNAGIKLSKLEGTGTFGGVTFSGGSISAPGAVVAEAGTPGQVALTPSKITFGLTGSESSLYLAANGMLKTDGQFVTNGSIYLNNDSARLFFGTNNDASFYHATSGVIATDQWLTVGGLITGAGITSTGVLSTRVLAGDIGGDIAKADTITINSFYHRITLGSPNPITRINGAEKIGQIVFLYNATGLTGSPMFAAGGNVHVIGNNGVMTVDEFRFLFWDGSLWQIGRG